MEYKVIMHHTQFVFEELVNNDIKRGWIPIGGVAKSQGTDFMQAMIKKDNKK
jgi:hypothetical protein